MATNTIHGPVAVDKTLRVGRRRWHQTMTGIAAVVIILATALTAVLVLTGGSEEQDAVDRDTLTRRLVNQGLIPAAALESTATSDELTRRLVNQGLIPAAALESTVTSDELTPRLVNQGLVPAATMGRADPHSSPEIMRVFSPGRSDAWAGDPHDSPEIMRVFSPGRSDVWAGDPHDSPEAHRVYGHP